MKLIAYLSALAGGIRATMVVLSMGGLFGMVQAARAASPSELLEKGIYSEETKGDLEAAMQLYRQVVNEAKEGQTVAAQAQYRLGVCYYKKKNYAEATAAFEKLLKDYPDQKELVALADQYLAGATALLPPPWTDGEQMRLEIKFPTGFKLGMAVYGVHSGETNGQKIWRLSSRMFAGVQSFSRVEVEAESFQPIHSRWKHVLIGDAEASYAPGRAELKTAGKEAIKKIDLSGTIYDNEEAVQLMRRLPLAANYKTSLRFLASLSSSIVPVKLEVAAIEKLEVPAGTFECYKVELSIRQTFWYSTDAQRYLVKFEAGGVAAELSSVGHMTPGVPVQYKDSTMGFSLTAPPDWLFESSNPEDEKNTARVFILDPDATATSFVNVQSLENLKPEMRKSLREWAEKDLSEAARMMKDFQLRPEGWQERKVAGRPGWSVVSDYLEGQEKKTGYCVTSFGVSNAVQFISQVAAKDFEALRPKLDAIIDSYKGD